METPIYIPRQFGLGTQLRMARRKETAVGQVQPTGEWGDQNGESYRDDGGANKNQPKTWCNGDVI